MSTLGSPSEQDVAGAWKAAMQDVVNVASMQDIPELNEYQCGTYQMHSLEEAQDIARDILAQGIGVNRNEDLALGSEKLQSLGNDLT